MKTNGARKAIASAIRTLWFATASRKRRRRTRGGGRRRTSGAATSTEVISARPSRVVHPPARVEQDHERDREGDGQKQHGHRRGVAHLEISEAVRVEQDGVEEGRVLGVAETDGGDVGRLRG